MSKSKQTTARKPKSTKGKKDGGPKKPLSAYMCFARARRPEILKDHPDLKSKVTEISKMIGADWGKLTETEKKKYTGEAEKDRERYEKEKTEFENKKKAGSTDDDEGEEAEE